MCHDSHGCWVKNQTNSDKNELNKVLIKLLKFVYEKYANKMKVISHLIYVKPYFMQ